MTVTNCPKKLIEVALPLDEINAACKADKDRKTGTIRNLHKWFAPMPLPAWRALLFAALVDDPGDEEKRAYLLDVIKRLMQNGADLPDKVTVKEARKIMEAQFPNGVPIVIDPFCGGGSTLVEAQRLGLPTYGSDLNPIPVLITRTLTELLPKVYGNQPIHPESLALTTDRSATTPTAEQGVLLGDMGGEISYVGYNGLIQDSLFYASRVREIAWERLRQYYPDEPGERSVAWLWARTAICPNPACGIETVLTTSWWLSKKKGDLAWIEPNVREGVVTLSVISGRRSGEAPPSPKAGRGASFNCLSCGGLLTDVYLQEVGASGGLGLRMVAIAAEQGGKRIYRAPTERDLHAVQAAADVDTSDVAQISLGEANRYITPPAYGIKTQADLYTPRQRLKMKVVAECVARSHRVIIEDGGSPAWADAVTTLLGLAVGKLAQYDSTQCRWFLRSMAISKAVSAFDRGDYPMMWDFAETSFVSHSVGDWMTTITSELRSLLYAPNGEGSVRREDARTSRAPERGLVAADPPYFDAIGYADLSDYFYVWHRRALRDVHPDLYATAATPKSGELTAFPWHHGGTHESARRYFIEGFTETFKNLQLSMSPSLPMLIIYASKEQKAGREEETRWSSILTAMMEADLQITGTWPIHGTGSARMRGIGSNAVATYVAMVCRPRAKTAISCSLGDFNRTLRRELKPAVHDLQGAGILPVDLAQAAMGPGMQVYSRYREILDQSGRRVPVDQALRLINAALGEVLDEQEGELDSYSRFAVSWWEKHGWAAAVFGEADQLARPQGISVDDVVRAEVACYPRPGFVSLLGSGGLDRQWKPSADSRPTAWEAVHHLVDRLIDGDGETEAGRLIGELGMLRDAAQALVYRLHDIAAKKSRTKDQERYNALIGSWSNLLAVAASQRDELF